LKDNTDFGMKCNKNMSANTVWPLQKGLGQCFVKEVTVASILLKYFSY